MTNSRDFLTRLEIFRVMSYAKSPVYKKDSFMLKLVIIERVKYLCKDKMSRVESDE